MREKRVKVALLFGGRSAEHEISLLSARSIYENLDREKYEIISIYITNNGNWKIVESPLLPPAALNDGPSFSFLPWSPSSSLPAVSADIYFPILHGPYGEDGTIQGFLEIADVPFAGASVMESAIAMDKAMTKTILSAKNLPVVPHLVIREEEWRTNREALLSRIQNELPLPRFAKPSCLGSSVGISKVRREEETPVAIEEALRYDEKILVEQGIVGRELECSVLGNENPEASLPGELFPSREFYDYRDKYIEGKTRFAVPAALSPARTEEIRHLSLAAFKAVGCRGMARVDFLMDGKTEKVFLSELNTIPGFTEISMYPKLWEASGLPFPRLLDRLLELGFERHRKKKKERESYNR